MGSWEQQPKAVSELLAEYINNNYPVNNIVFDAGRRLIRLDVPDLSDSDMIILISYLKQTYPGAF